MGKTIVDPFKGEKINQKLIVGSVNLDLIEFADGESIKKINGTIFASDENENFVIYFYYYSGLVKITCNKNISKQIKKELKEKMILLCMDIMHMMPTNKESLLNERFISIISMTAIAITLYILSKAIICLMM